MKIAYEKYILSIRFNSSDQNQPLRRIFDLFAVVQNVQIPRCAKSIFSLIEIHHNDLLRSVLCVSLYKCA